ncbi:MAG: vWA domain-containing protein [Acidobacteriota bacterium]
MSFLTPLFLLGTLALAAPILVHLVRREQAQRIPFSSLMFLRQVPMKVVRRQTVRNWLLLLLRCLALLLLILAFMRPYFPALFRADAQTGGRSIVVLLDNSFSMRAGQRWRQAVDRAVEVIERARPADRLAVIAFAETADLLNESNEDRRQVVAKVRGLQPGYRSTDARQALKLAAQWLGSSPAQGSVVYVVSDFQKTGHFDQSVSLPRDVKIETIAVENAPANLWIQDVRVSRNLYGSGASEKPVVVARNELGHAVNARLVLNVNGKPVQETTVKLAPNENHSVMLNAVELPPGVARCEVVLEPSDGLDKDNHFNFSLRRAEPGKILLLYQTDASPTLFLERAIASEPNSPFAVESRAVAGWDGSRNSADFVVLYQTAMTESVAARLRRFVQQGRSALWIPASQATRGYQDVLPAASGDRVILRREREKSLTLGEADWESPVFYPFRDLRARYFAGVQFYSYVPMEPVPGTRVLARFNNGSPALLERTVGNGRILAFGSGLDKEWTDFPLTSAFVPFVHRLLAYSLNVSAERSSYRVSDRLALGTLSMARETGQQNGWTVLGPAGQRVTGVESDRELDYLNLEEPGFYELRWNRQTEYHAVNVAPEESDLDAANPVLVAAGGAQQSSLASPSAARGEGEIEQRQSVWRWLLLLTGALLLAETVIANSRGQGSGVRGQASGVRE